MKKQIYLFSLTTIITASTTILAQNAIGFGSQTTNNQEQITKNALKGSGMCFTPNKGQIADMKGNLHPDILYKGDGGGADVYLRKTGMSFVTSNMGEVMQEINTEVELRKFDQNLSPQQTDELKHQLEAKALIKIQRTDVDFEGSNPNPQTLTEEEVEGYTNYYYAHCPNGITNVKSYNRVIQKNIYKGIDIIYYGGKQNACLPDRQGLKYDIVVNPGADPKQIKLKYTGAKVKLSSSKLIVTSELGETVETLPKVYQNINGKIVDVGCEYKIANSDQRLGNREKSSSPNPYSLLANHSIVSFELSTYNPNFPLIIDPWVTYYSGISGDVVPSCSGSGLATDATGNVIATGWTSSGSLPVSAGSFQGTYNGSNDCFVVKFSITGTRIFGTYFGGSSKDLGFGLAIDGANDILVTGLTSSGNFPTKDAGGGAYFQSGNAGGFDAFIAKFTPAGVLTWSTLYGGSLTDEGIDVNTDAANNVVLVGITQSVNFPVQASYQAAIGAGSTQNAFIAKFNSNCVRQWATYYGGTTSDGACGVTCDAARDIYIAGYTSSIDFPVLAGHQMTNGGTTDAFAVKLTGATGFPVWATYYGGSDIDQGTATATDAFGNVIIVGYTRSVNNISSPAANQTFCGSCVGINGDGFIVKFNATTGNRVWGTYVGGNNDEHTLGCAVDPANNNIYWYGEIEENEPGNFKINSCAYQQYTYVTPPPGGHEDFFISQFDPNGILICTTAFGGPDEEDGDSNPHTDIAIFGNYLYFTGWVADLLPVTPGAFQTTAVSRSQGGNAFVAQICKNICVPKFTGIDNMVADQTIICPNTTINFTSSVNKTLCSDPDMKFKWTFAGGTPSTSTQQNPSVVYATPGQYSVKLVVSTLCYADSVIKTNYIHVNPCTIMASVSGTTICSNECTNLTPATSGGAVPYTYNWSTGATSQTINVCPATTTTYTVTVKDASGASATIAALVTVRPTFDVTTSATDIPCNNIVKTGSAGVQANSGFYPYTFNWSNGYNGQFVSGLTAGTHSVTVTDAIGCKVTKLITINDPNPVASFTTPTTICVGSSATFTFTGTTGVDMRYNWTIGAPINVSGTTSSFSYIFLTAGSYSITYSVTNPNYLGCKASTTSTVTVISCNNPIVTTTGSSVCPGSCATATSSVAGGATPYTYTWSTGATTQNINPCPVSSTIYTVTVTDGGGNTATSTAVVTVNNINAQYTKGTANCSNCGCKEWIMVTGINGTPPYIYQWPDGYDKRYKNSLCPGIYNVIVTDGNGCKTTVKVNAP